jgi:hypothetical protein
MEIFKIGDLVQMVFSNPVVGIKSKHIASQVGVIKNDLGDSCFEVLWPKHMMTTVVHRVRLKKVDNLCP